MFIYRDTWRWRNPQAMSPLWPSYALRLYLFTPNIYLILLCTSLCPTILMFIFSSTKTQQPFLAAYTNEIRHLIDNLYTLKLKYYSRENKLLMTYLIVITLNWEVFKSLRTINIKYYDRSYYIIYSFKHVVIVVGVLFLMFSYGAPGPWNGNGISCPGSSEG